MEKRKKSCMGGNMERIELCPYCSSSLFLASESVLTVKDQRAAGCGHVPYPQGACSSQELRMDILRTYHKLPSAVGLGMSTPAGS